MIYNSWFDCEVSDYGCSSEPGGEIVGVFTVLHTQARNKKKQIQRSTDVLTAATSESSTLARRTLPHMYGIVWYRGRDGSSSSSSSM